MSKSLAQIPYSDFALTLLSGAEKGTNFRLPAGRITIGRGSDNDIVIKDDPKISRQHAVLIITSRSIEISDVSDRNKVYVNGDEVTSRTLAPGAIIQLGETKFQLKNLGGAQLEAVHGGGLTTPQSYGSGNSMGYAAAPRRSSRSQGKSKKNFYILVAVIGLLFMWLLTSSPKKKAEDGLRFSTDVDASIENNNKQIENLQAERLKNGMDTRQYEEAQPNFVKGFRDFRKGQYDRAIESFQACLSLFPQHVQCNHYLRLSQKKFSELVQYHMILGAKYKDQNQFAACKSAYRNAMVMIRNTTDKNYLEAKSGYESCELLQKDRY